MNAWGWVFMLTSLTLVWVTTIWAYCRLLGAPREEPKRSALTRPALQRLRRSAASKSYAADEFIRRSLSVG